MSNFAHFKKYKVIIASIMIFLVLDASVLIFNLYISRQIINDTLVVELAGHQGSLTQRITKNLLEFERAYDKSKKYDYIVDDIKSSMATFDDILSAFDVGGLVTIDGREILVDPITDAEGRSAIEKTKPMWAIYKNYTADVLNEFEERKGVKEDVVTIFFRESIVNDVVQYATHSNLDLLKVMHKLADSVSRVTSEKTKKLRSIQTFAIFLAVINFFFIVFVALKNLIKSDSELEFANAELDVMLNAITEGIFLLDSGLKISEQYSKEMVNIFNDKTLSGKDLLSVLEGICHQFNREGTKEFLHTLFDENKNMKILEVLNPLQKVLVRVAHEGSVFDDKRYLRFSYSRIISDGVIERVLVRVSDISSDVLREQVLNEERGKQFKQLRLMSALMNSNADMLPVFFQRSFYCFDCIGSILKSPVGGEKELGEKVNSIDVLLQEFQQDAKRLSLESLSDVAGDLQFELEKIKSKDKLCVDDFHELSLVLDHLVSHTESVYKFSNKILAETTQKAPQAAALPQGDVSWVHLSAFSDAIAEKEDKDVEFVMSGLNDHILSKTMLRLVNSIVLQLIYHSVVISIESPRQRAERKKSSFAMIDVRLVKKKSGGYYLTIRNDGSGVNVDEMKAISSDSNAAYVPSENISNRQLLLLLMYSCNPEENKPLSYDGELAFGETILDFIEQNRVKFDIKTVSGEGSVFEFMFPAGIV